MKNLLYIHLREACSVRKRKMHTPYRMLHLPLKGEKYLSFYVLTCTQRSSGRTHYKLIEVAGRAI